MSSHSKKIGLGLVAIMLVVFTSFKQEHPKQIKPLAKLSDYYFFEGDIAKLIPKQDLIPYSLNTPLFSDYAEKLRFIKLPENAKIVYKDKEVLEFPLGTILIKNFFFPVDFRKPEKGRQIIETRLLTLNEDGWRADVYVWNEQQNEAYLEVAGEDLQVKYIDAKGKKKSHSYAVPNINQCKGCHNLNEKFEPIGPTARALNGPLRGWGLNLGMENQLVSLQNKHILAGLPELSTVEKAAVWDDSNSGSLEQRARTYLDINCAYCHREGGPAQTSGLFLDVFQENTTALGIYKTPVAAGRGAGPHQFDIVPSKPEQSILIYRMQSSDPGIMMPEVGRKTIHAEGVELIKAWIKDLKP